MAMAARRSLTATSTYTRTAVLIANLVAQMSISCHAELDFSRRW